MIASNVLYLYYSHRVLHDADKPSQIILKFKVHDRRSRINKTLLDDIQQIYNLNIKSPWS